MATTKLPIDDVLPALCESLRTGTSAVLVAQPGAGKTTRAPLALLEEPWLQGNRIVMLEPRRLAARSAAQYMASLIGENVGETVGYRVRHDTRISAATRIEIVTEGVLTRMLQTDPALEGIGIIIFDEFHERSLDADLGLALCLESRAVLREDLRILVMSATMDAEAVAALIGAEGVIQSEGRTYPVETHYLPRPATGPIETAVARAIQRALNADTGDILTFLPGAREIRRVAEILEASELEGVSITPLHGSLTREEQSRAIAPCADGRRKIVLATPIAETSLTVEGVRVVVDSGWMRVPRFSPATGMSRLETVRISKASADQRRGRAGRLAPGVCYRLWTEQEHRALSERSKPEILEADLAPLCLELAAWGIRDPGELRWLDRPPQAAFARSVELLKHLGALDASGHITTFGRQMTSLGVHPRLAHMLLKAEPLGLGELACHLAAVLQERDILRPPRGGARHSPEETLLSGTPDPDLTLRIEALLALRESGSRNGPGADGELGRIQERIDTAAARSALTEAERLRRRLRDAVGNAPSSARRGRPNPRDCGACLAFAFPDRISQRRPSGGFLVRGGRGATLDETHPLSQEPYLVAAHLDDRGANSRILLAAPMAPDGLEAHFAHEIESIEEIAWDSQSKSVKATARKMLGALVLQERPLVSPDPDRVREVLLQGIELEGLHILPWTRGAKEAKQRICFARRHSLDLPDLSDETLLASLREWLGPHLYGCRSADDLHRLNLTDILYGQLSWEQRRQLDALAPSHFSAPSGSRIPVDYSDPEAPAVPVRIQEMFGLEETPRVAAGRIPLTLHLLSPAGRPVQVTQDLAGFWRRTYFDVRKELKGRYPKHPWPDDPLTATPTHRVKRK